MSATKRNIDGSGALPCWATGDELVSLSTEDAARALGIAPGTLANWRRQGRGPRFARVGRRVVYPIDELRRFLRESMSGRGE